MRDYFDGPGRDWLEIVPRSYAQPEIRARPSEYRPAYTYGLNPLSADQLLTRKFDPPEHVLAPWLQTQGLAIFTLLGASAKPKFPLVWRAPWPQERAFSGGLLPSRGASSSSTARCPARCCKNVSPVRSNAQNTDMAPDSLKLVAADFEPDGLPDLASEEGQQYYGDVIAPADLVIVDNLSTICRTLRENEADSWAPVQAWVLRLRREGKSVLFIHHAGKSGGQRGTSKKEDILNTVIALRRPPDYEASQGARFEVHYEKARGFYGNDAEPFEAWLKDGKWQIGDLTPADDDASLLALKKQGLSDREIEKRTGVPKSTVNRKLREKLLP